MDPEFNCLTALTQFRNFLVNKGTTISDKDVERCNLVKNTTTVKAERHYLRVDGLLWFYLDSFVEYVKDTYNGSISKDGPRSQTEITEQEAHAFVEVLLYPLLCHSVSSMSFHEYLGSDSKPGVYAKGGSAMKMKYSTFWKIQSVVKENMVFDILSNIFFQKTMDLFDFKGSNFLSLDETIVSFHTMNPE